MLLVLAPRWIVQLTAIFFPRWRSMQCSWPGIWIGQGANDALLKRAAGNKQVMRCQEPEEANAALARIDWKAATDR